MNENCAKDQQETELTNSSINKIMEEFKQFFQVNDLPFMLLPNTQYYVSLPSAQQCLSTLIFALSCGEGMIKITGEVGTGKTLVCRRLLNSLDEKVFYTAYIPNPNLSPEALMRELANELGVKDLEWVEDDQLMSSINHRLLTLAQNNKKTVLVIDEAQVMKKEALESLRLLTNLETEKQKLLQIVLFGQPELDKLLKQHDLRQLTQRITYSQKLQPLNKKQVDQYLRQRLNLTGYQGPEIFESSAIHYLFKFSRGIPRIINILSSKALLLAFSKGVKKVDGRMIKRAALDTEGVVKPMTWLMAI